MKKVLIIVLVLYLLASLPVMSACATEEPEEQEELRSAQEVVDGVVDSMDTIRTYQCDIDATWESTTEREGEAYIRTFAQNYSWTLDVENRQGRKEKC